MPRLGAFKTAKNLAAAFEAAQRAEIPILITYEIPDARIENTVVNLTVEEKVVYLALDPKVDDLRTLLARFQLRSFSGSLLDHHGNVLEKGLVTSNDMVDAVENLDDLLEEARARFAQNLTKGRRLVEKREFRKALRVLEVFAFAEGIPEAEAGKALFEQAARVAEEAYQVLLAKAPNRADGEAGDAFAKKLRRFSRRWRGSPAGRAAKREAEEWKARPAD